MKSRKLFPILAFALVTTLGTLASSAPTFAYDENSPRAVNVDAKGVSLKGYDPVAYFTKGKPTPGRADITASHAGATYQFATTEHRDLFRANPARYAPQYGGSCAMGVSLEKKLDGDPLVWHIANDKLYVNVNEDVQTRYLEDVTGNNKRADSIWPIIRNKVPKAIN